jgi:environmental stress-induced protein Ves
MKLRLLALSVVIGTALSFSACGGGSMGGVQSTGGNHPPPTTYTIGGTIAGLTATGLVLQNNSGDNLAASANQASFTFSTPIDSGSNYAVTVLTQPAGETCAVTNGSGLALSNVTDVTVSCSVNAVPTYTISGTISGLAGTGLQLQNSGTTQTIASGATTFSFTGVPSGSAYNVTVLTQPSSPTQTCTVTNGSGTINGNVTNVAVACSTVTYTISGTISGLAGTGLVLQDNGTSNLTIAAGATSFTFSTQIPSGSTYNVTVLTQPTNPTQTCTVTNGSGTVTGNVTNVAVACSTATYTISGTISGLAGTGLVLQDNGTSNLTIAGGATSFTFSTQIPSGSTYNVTVLTQPTSPTQTCSVTNGSGTATGNVTNVAVTCSTTTYTIGGTISGLTGTGLVLQDNGTSNLTIAAGATTFTFSTQIPSGGTYAVTVFTQPTTQTCSVTNGTGTATGNVTNVAVTCSTTTYTIGGTITGLTGTGLVLQDNGTSNLTIAAGATTFTFSTQIPSGGTYAVTVFTQPTNPNQTCSVTNGSGTATGNVTNVAVTCSTTTYTIGGTISGLTGTGLVLQDNGTSNLTIAAGATTFTFSTQIPSGGTYAVTVFTQPTNPTQTCTVANGSGTATGNVTNVAVTCASTTYTIGGTISGLTGTGLVLQDNGTSNLTIAAGATTFTFTTQIPSGGTYAVTVFTQPTNPTQTCTVANGSGTATGNVTNVAVTCSTTTYTIGGTISGLTGTGLVLQDNGTSNLTIAAGATSFTFTTQIPSGSTYNVTVLTQPTNPTETCTVTNGSGTATGNVTNVAVACTTSTGFTIGGTIAGLTGSGLVLQDNGGNNLTITSGQTSFTFSTQIPAGSPYSVTVFTQPTNPTQTCTVTDGSGTANANVTNVLVACNNQWTWQNGANVTNVGGTYGTKFGFLPGNVPGARYGAVTWTDSSGNFWLFGGNGVAAGIESYLNDLWEWDGTQWSWRSGANATDQIGVYGTGSGFVPGARIGAVGWKDSSGNLWLFGGYGFDSLSTDDPGPLNDLWEYSPSTKEWSFISGSEFINGTGTYGTKGNGNSKNVPGSRYYASASTDASGNFWLFGGYGFDSQGNEGSLNDLWEYSATLSEWIWISGADTQGQVPNYGTQGSGSNSTVPGARQGLVSWMDSSNNFWLFGGLGIGSVVDSNPVYGALNDTWEYMPSTLQWVWQGPLGSNLGPDQPGNYVAIGQAGTPGGRSWPTGWLDSSGNFWLFGGQEAGDGDGLNDLWLYSNGTWTWESGSSSPNQPGNYPLNVGTTGPTYAPGARWNLASWLDKNNNLWLFGGSGFDGTATDPPGVLNDLWEFQP